MNAACKEEEAGPSTAGFTTVSRTMSPRAPKDVVAGSPKRALIFDSEEIFMNTPPDTGNTQMHEDQAIEVVTGPQSYGPPWTNNTR